MSEHLQGLTNALNRAAGRTEDHQSDVSASGWAGTIELDAITIELDAMQSAYDALRGLDGDTRARVVTWLIGVLHLYHDGDHLRPIPTYTPECG